MSIPETPRRDLTTVEALPEALGIRLTPLEERFCWAYCETYNLADAYLQASGSNAKRQNASKSGSLLYAKAHVRERIRAIRMPALERAGVTLERTLLELKRVAYMDPRKLFKRDKGGQLVLRDIDEMDADTAAALSSIDMKGAGDDIGKIVGVTFKQKAQALDMMMKYHGGYERDNNQRGENLKVQVLVVAPTQEPRPD